MTAATPPIMTASSPFRPARYPAECTPGPSQKERTGTRRPGCRDVLPEPSSAPSRWSRNAPRSTGPTRRWTVPECARIPAWGIAPMCRWVALAAASAPACRRPCQWSISTGRALAPREPPEPSAATPLGCWPPDRGHRTCFDECPRTTRIATAGRALCRRIRASRLPVRQSLATMAAGRSSLAAGGGFRWPLPGRWWRAGIGRFRAASRWTSLVHRPARRCCCAVVRCVSVIRCVCRMCRPCRRTDPGARWRGPGGR